MEMKNNHYFLLLFLCFSLNSNLCRGRYTISVNESLSFGETLVSSGERFELGFVRPGNSLKYYLGIWYKNVILSQTVVWVANRDKPLDYGAAELIISEGNLVLLDRFQGIVWSALAGSINPDISVTALLRDDGNLILSDVSNSSTPLLLWQSFDHPTHTFMPGAKIGYDKRTQRKQVLVSWKNSSDPAPGLYSMEMDPKNAQYVLKWNRTMEYWATGSWDGQMFSSVPSSHNTNITVGEASQCRSACFNNCFCTAYTYDGSGTCSIWTGDLFNS